jgi:phosphatidylglycerophosphatase C
MDTGAMTDAAAASERIVLFDFDGVLLDGDAFSLFVRARFDRASWRKALLVACLPLVCLLALASHWLAARFGVRLAFLFVGAARYERAAVAFGRELARRPKLFLRDAVGALRRHVAAGDRVIVVTGCEHYLARAILDELGLQGIALVASAMRPGWFGMHLAWHNIQQRKVTALAREGVTAWVVAYSDSSRDIPMLRVAAEPFLVNASPRVCKKVEKALGRSVGRVAWY